MHEAQAPVQTTTRVIAGDDGTNYDGIAITLHWVTALLVVVQFVMAKSWDAFPKETRETMESVHVSLGVLLAGVIIARLIWRWIPGHQRSSLEIGWVKLASKAVHYVIYLLLVIQAGLGFGWRWAQGHTASFFGLFAIPGPYGELGRPTRHIFHDLHENVAWAIIILAGLHALAALYHHYVVKDRVLERMLPLAGRRA